MNAEISETVKPRLLGLGKQIPSFLRSASLFQNRFDARIKILTEMYCSYQYLSIDPKKSLPRLLKRHKLQKIVSMNADISENIKYKELGSQT